MIICDGLELHVHRVHGDISAIMTH